MGTWLFRFILLFQLLAPATYANICHIFEQPTRITPSNTELKLIRGLFKYDIRRVANCSGFQLTHPEAQDFTFVQLPVFPLDEFVMGRAERWEYGGQSYYFVDVGARHLERTFKIINKIAAEHVFFDRRNLLFEYYPEAADQIRRARAYRQTIHDAVLDWYRRRKKYLTSADFHALRESNFIFGNTDVLAILTTEPDAYKINIKSVAGAIQLTHPGHRNYQRPSLKGMYQSIGMPGYERHELFPFEHRIKLADLFAFREKFEQEFVREKTGELIRYGRLKPLPAPILDRLVLEAFKRGRLGGLEKLIASCDRATGCLFKRKYGFQKFEDLPIRKPRRNFATLKKAPDEHLAYFDLWKSKEVFEKLTESAHLVTVQAVDFQ